MRVRTERRVRQVAACAVACLIGALVVDPVALAKYAATAGGSGTSRALVLAVPPAPGAVPASLLGLLCTITVTWTAPPTIPSQQQYAITRVMNGAPTVIRANQTASGSYTDVFLLPGISARNVTYSTQTSLVSDPLWVQTSSSAAVSC